MTRRIGFYIHASQKTEKKTNIQTTDMEYGEYQSKEQSKGIFSELKC